LGVSKHSWKTGEQRVHTFFDRKQYVDERFV